MARSILEIAQEAAERDATAPAPTALFGTNDRVARILRKAAHDTLREYLRKSNWIGMSEFMSAWVFATRPGRFAYPMPPDFLRIIPNTEQRNGWTLGLVGPATPQVWARWVFGNEAVATPMGWRIRNNALYLEPTPSATELVVIEYISRYPVVSAIQDGDYDLTADPLIAVSPLVARDGWIDVDSSAVITSSTTSSASEGRYGQDPGWDEAVWGTSPEAKLRFLDPTSNEAPLPKVRRPEFTADTDEPAFEDDHLLSLGMTFRLQRALGLPYAEVAAEYEEEMEMKIATDAGGARCFRLGNSGDTWDVAPLGNGKWLVS